MKRNKTIFGRWEVVCVLITMVSAKSILDYPRVLAEDVGTAGWLLVVIITLAVLALYTIIVRLYSPLGSNDIIDLGDKAGGRALRTISGLVMILYFGSYTVFYLREYGEQMKALALTDTPISFVMLFFIAGMLLAGYLGLESLARFQSLMVPVVVISYITYVIILSPYFELPNVMPILGNGLDSIARSFVFRLSDYSELLFLFLLAPFLRSWKNLKTSGYYAIGLNAFFLISVSLTYSLIIPYPISLQNLLPVYKLGQVINYSRFFQRVEPLFVTTWSFIGLMFLSNSFYFAVYCFQKTFMLKKRRPLLLPAAVIVFTLALLPSSFMENIINMYDSIRKWSWVVTFCFTIALLSIVRLRMKIKKAAA